MTGHDTIGKGLLLAHDRVLDLHIWPSWSHPVRVARCGDCGLHRVIYGPRREDCALRPKLGCKPEHMELVAAGAFFRPEDADRLVMGLQS